MADCPVCLIPMHVLRPGKEMSLDHCHRCGGIWCDPARYVPLERQQKVIAQQVLSQYGGQKTWSALCHFCHEMISRDAVSCEHCGKSNRIPCPACGENMAFKNHKGVRLDQCRQGHGIWLDHHELDALWGLYARSRQTHAVSGGVIADRITDITPEIALDVVLAASDIEALSGTVSGVTSGVAAGAEGITEASGHVFSFLMEIIGSVFEGL